MVRGGTATTMANAAATSVVTMASMCRAIVRKP